MIDLALPPVFAEREASALVELEADVSVQWEEPQPADPVTSSSRPWAIANAVVRSSAWTAASALRTGELMARSLAEPGHSEELLSSVARDLATASRAVAEMAKVVAGGASVTAALVQVPAGGCPRSSPAARPP